LINCGVVWRLAAISAVPRPSAKFCKSSIAVVLLHHSDALFERHLETSSKAAPQSADLCREAATRPSLGEPTAPSGQPPSCVGMQSRQHASEQFSDCFDRAADATLPSVRFEHPQCACVRTATCCVYRRVLTGSHYLDFPATK
jgi:hypothetical protein